MSLCLSKEECEQKENPFTEMSWMPWYLVDLDQQPLGISTEKGSVLQGPNGSDLILVTVSGFCLFCFVLFVI